MKTFHQLLAADPNVSEAFRAALTTGAGPSVTLSEIRPTSTAMFTVDGPVECDWCGCTTHEPVFRNGLQFAPSCLPAYEADQAEQAEIDAELARDSDHPEPPVRNLQMRRKQAARETGAEQGIEDVA